MGRLITSLIFLALLAQGNCKESEGSGLLFAFIGGVGLVVAAPVALGAIGFTAAGVTAGSVASAMMSSAAIANGGAIAAGSTVAVLQSAGAAGLSVATKAALFTAGAGVAELMEN